MNTDDIQFLYEYDRWANHRVIEAASALTQEQFTRDLGGSFSSVRDTLVHILAGEWIWLSYWGVPELNITVENELRSRRNAIFQPSLFPDCAAVQSKWAEVEAMQTAFIDNLTDDRLRMRLPFRSGHASLVHLMQHMANHSTYHRGQVSLMMRQLQAQPVTTDFALFLGEKLTAPAAGAPAS
jgi:uncharacterized damage-inducible protein DinB